MNNFSMNSSTTAKAEDDSVGITSDVHDAEIKMAYVTKAKSGALGLVVEARCTKGFYKETLWFCSGDEKGNKTFFLDKSGDEVLLPGYICFKALLNLTGSDTTPEQQVENGLKPKIADVYDFDLKKNVPTEVPTVMDLLDKKVKLGLIQTIEDKYNKPGETQEKVILDKVFNTEGLTTTEAAAKIEAPEFINKWLTKNKDKVKNKAKGGAAKGGAKAGRPAAATKPAEQGALFADDDDDD